MFSKTTRRIFPTGRTNSLPHVENLTVDLSRLTEVAKKQQEIILEYATHEYRAEQALPRLEVDESTSKWIQSCFSGDGSMRELEDDNMDEANVFNTAEKLRALQERVKLEQYKHFCSWDFDLFAHIEADKGSESQQYDRLVKLAANCISVFEFSKHLEELKEVNLEDVVKQIFDQYQDKSLINTMKTVESFRVLTIMCIYIDPNVDLFPAFSYIDIFSLLLAGLVLNMKQDMAHPGYLQGCESMKVFFEKMDGLIKQFSVKRQSRIRRVVQTAMLATDAEMHWTVVHNLDMLASILVDRNLKIKSARTRSGDPAKMDTKNLHRGLLLQGMFRTAVNSFICLQYETSTKWLEVSLEGYVEMGLKEEKLGQPMNIYAQSLKEAASAEDNGIGSGPLLNGGANSEPASRIELTKQLIALNWCDFISAPLWVALSYHISSLQEPMALLTLNRMKWSEALIRAREFQPNLHRSLRIRERAFQETFASVQFEPGCNKMDTRHEDPMLNYSKDFVSIQNRSLRCTGATVYFLSLIGNVDAKRATVKDSLQKSIGYLEDAFRRNPSKDGGKGINATSTNLLNNEFDDPGTLKRSEDDVTKKAEENGSKNKDGKLSGHANLVVLPSTFLQRRKTVEANKKDLIQRDKSFHGMMERILHHPATYPMLSCLTVFALFGDDIRLAVFPIEADPAFGWITFVTLLMFILEMVAKIVCVPNYKNGFFFWLDLVATVSLIPDIPLLWDPVITFVEDIYQDGGDTEDLSLTRASRASRAGARAARIIRILRIVRLLRILKLYEFLHLQFRRKAAKAESREEMLQRSSSRYVSRYLIKRRMSTYRTGQNMLHTSTKDLMAKGTWQQSKVGAKLADLTTRRVIIVVLLILFLMPIMSLAETDYSFEASVGMLHVARIQHTLNMTSNETLAHTLESFKQGTPRLISLKFITSNDTTFSFENPKYDIKSLRTSEKRSYFASCNDETKIGEDLLYCLAGENNVDSVKVLKTEGWVHHKDFEVESAWRSILQTFFIIIIFGMATMMFTYDAHKLVIAPIEKMVRIVEELAQNPLTTFDNDDDDDSDNEGDNDLIRRAKQKHKEKLKKQEEEDQGAYETKLLENCIKKIGGLLQVGFGEAGAEIIASNMNGTGELDPMLPGRKVQAIFGFCDIRQFMAATEILGEEVMLYVNEIANIVHTQVASHSGQANRNMGDSFLLIWKRRAGAEETWTQIAEKALISFLKINIEITRSNDLAVYMSPAHKIGARLLKNIPDFKVRLGFGLHIGWAIEGAIGSNRKIDASYLSPHVNLASRLEQITRLYKVNILFSGEFYDQLGNDAQKCSRKIDQVLLKGLHDPVTLYTYDCNFDDLTIKLQAIRLKGDGNQDEEDVVVDRRISLIGPSPIIDHQLNLVHVHKSAFRTDLELRALQWDLPTHFLPLCRKGVALYQAGRWKEAKTLMEAAVKIMPAEAEGPCGFLLRYMASKSFVAPMGWKGFRGEKDTA